MELEPGLPWTSLGDRPGRIDDVIPEYDFTGTYEALQLQISDDRIAELKMIAQLYGIAVKYNIAGLSVILQDQTQVIAKTLISFRCFG